MGRLARCTTNHSKEKNIRRNLHKWVDRSGRQLNIEISFVSCPVRTIRKGQVKQEVQAWPVVHFSQWLRCALQDFGGKLVLGGHHITEQGKWQGLFQTFWDTYRSVDPQHPIYDSVSHGNQCLYLPYTFHGDEGRGKNKTPLLIESFQVVLTNKGVDHTNLSGHTFTNRFLFTAMSSTSYTDSSLDALHQGMAEDLNRLFTEGVEVTLPNGDHVRVFAACIGGKGDWVYLRKGFGLSTGWNCRRLCHWCDCQAA
ncbi:unnamed protein product [Durusdinium trenchii]|uniref:Uncharacterized protein n=1 Tax=Durusdinium trenchii TaxID=1381693 RepID=A0ABP0SUB3_9DINO